MRPTPIREKHPISFSNYLLILYVNIYAIKNINKLRPLLYLFPKGKNSRIVLELFRLLDIHNEKVLNDVQFWAFMKTATDLTKNQIYKVFDMLDVDRSGAIDFDEFYLLICILIAVDDNEEKHFIYRHSRTVFDLLDEDSSGNISAYEFETFGFMFNLHGEAIRTIFSEFDVSGDQVIPTDFPNSCYYWTSFCCCH